MQTIHTMASNNTNKEASEGHEGDLEAEEISDMMPRIKLMEAADKMLKCYKTEPWITANSAFMRHLGDFNEIFKSFSSIESQRTLPLLVTPFLAIGLNQHFPEHFSEDVQLKLIGVLRQIFLRTYLNDETAFYKLNSFLLALSYDPKTIIKAAPEEIKLAVMECFIALYTRLSWQILTTVYVEANMPIFCALLHLCTDLLKREQSRELRRSAVECMMTLKRIDDTADPSDVVLLSQIAALFTKYIPGTIGRLIVATDDHKCGHRLLVTCVKAWGRLVSMHLRQYEPLEASLETAIEYYQKMNEKNTHDDHICQCAGLLIRLANHSHPDVRRQLAESCKLLIETCFLTLPETIPKIIELLIVLSQSSPPEDSKVEKILQLVVAKLCEENYAYKWMLDKVLENFYKNLIHLPTIFNNVDDSTKINALSLVSGFLRLFGKTDKMKFILFTRTNVERLVGSLLLIATVEKSSVSLLEEYTLHDWKICPDKRTPWKIFKYANDAAIQEKLYSACHFLAEPLIFNIIFEYLQDVFHQNADQRSEVVILLNEIISVETMVEIKSIHEQVLELYLDPRYWNLDVSVTPNSPLKQVQSNIVQICLELEGIGKVALISKHNFKDHLLKVLYAILEKAGSDHTLLRAAGLACIANVSLGCGYQSVTELINDNADYFAYHVVNKLRRLEGNHGVLKVLGVVLQYSSMEVLNAISDIIEGVLMRCFDQYRVANIQAYLQLFHIFIKAMHLWLNVEKKIEPMKSKQQKELEREEQRQQYLDELRKQDFSDNVLQDSTEEMLAEDIKQSLKELESETHQDSELEEVMKPPPPKHIQLIIAILERSLHFLPAKQVERKILVLEILILGVQMLNDYEDDLLPMVHKIWSPLVNRFKEFENPLIINLSFKLLSTLGLLAKEFIRMRSIKEVLPEINSCLIWQSKESYLKDKGSAYRYTQGYKMQLTILSSLGRFAYDLDLGEQIKLVEEGVHVYLSNYQPIPLQRAALDFYRCVCFFDYDLFATIANNAITKYKNDRLFTRNIDIVKEMMGKPTR